MELRFNLLSVSETFTIVEKRQIKTSLTAPSMVRNRNLRRGYTPRNVPV